MGALDTARQLDSWGFRVVPVVARGKSPALRTWREFQEPEATTTAQLENWFTGRGERYNFGAITGRASTCVVLDVDNDETLAWFRRQEGVAELLDATSCAKTAKGWHFYFRTDPDQVVDGTAQHEDVQGVRIDWDLRGEGGHIVLPPSIHETGHTYAWVRTPEVMLPWSRWPGVSGDVPRETPVGRIGGTQRRSQLAKLLASPAQEGGRNNWMAQVAGHLAKLVPHGDAYTELVASLNLRLVPPLDEEEWQRTARSIWEAEQDKDVEPTANTGWLTEKDGRLWTLCRVKNGEEQVEIWKEWADFTLRAVGIIEVDGDQQYVVDVVTQRKTVRAMLSRKELGEWRRLAVWLSGYGATVAPPPEEHPKAARISKEARLQRWLMSQQPEHFRAVDTLGWHEGIGFVCHEGVITAAGLQGHSGVMLDPKLRDRTPYKYGFVDGDEARAVLAEVLTFHDPTVCAVFGAWWVATLLKPQIEPMASLFPFMALEAPSESGKTTGFFSLMLQLAGNAHGQGEYTLPVLRDRAGAHKSGIVWVDDISDPTGVLDLLRQATSGGSRSKKAQDRTSEETVRLVASVVLSGEGLGSLGAEKALIDRAIRLEVPPVKGRRSLNDAQRAQWDDILALRGRYPEPDGLTRVAGTLVQLVLRHAALVRELPKMREGSGRHADKLAILLVGARILAELLDDVSLLTRVEEWTRVQEDSDENFLTTTMLPWVLRVGDLPSQPNFLVPAFVDGDGGVWWHEEGLADYWRQNRRQMTSRERQLGSLESIRAQRRALGLTGPGKKVRITKPGGMVVYPRYHGVPASHGTGVAQSVRRRTGIERDEPDTLLEKDGG